MLSKREREFLYNPQKFSKSYARWLRYNIRRKLHKITRDLELISQTWPQVLEDFPTLIVNVRENPNEKKLISHEKASKKGIWGNFSFETGPGGFEPPTPGLEGRCAIQAALRALPNRYL